MWPQAPPWVPAGAPGLGRAQRLTALVHLAGHVRARLCRHGGDTSEEDRGPAEAAPAGAGEAAGGEGPAPRRGDRRHHLRWAGGRAVGTGSRASSARGAATACSATRGVTHVRGFLSVCFYLGRQSSRQTPSLRGFSPQKPAMTRAKPGQSRKPHSSPTREAGTHTPGPFCSTSQYALAGC